MKTVWIDAVWRDTVWALLHHINIHMSSRVKHPSIAISGSGGSARMNMLLPEPEAAAGAEGMFLVTLNEDKKLDVTAGYALLNGVFVAVPESSGIAREAGILCVCAELSDTGTWSDPELKIATPSATAYPVAKIEVADGAASITQYPVTVAVLMATKTCRYAEGLL